MTNTAERSHFNLYYIFKEDKENNTISQKTAAEIWRTVCLSEAVSFDDLRIIDDVAEIEE